MTAITVVLPNYSPKINETYTEKVDLNIRDLQNKYPNGCICCGNTYTPKKYSSLISQHFNTAKHKKKCLIPANLEFKDDYGASISIQDAYDDKCKEVRELKKLNYKYKDELDDLKCKFIDLQTQILKKNKLDKFDNQDIVIRCDDLIDFTDS